jgi:hypothetical protein
MSNETKTVRVINTNGVGFFTLLGLLFIALKLTGVITWPWIWVLAPLWIPLAIVMLILIIGFCWVAWKIYKDGDL